MMDILSENSKTRIHKVRAVKGKGRKMSKFIKKRKKKCMYKIVTVYS
jgi:hypothetical protein